MGSALLLLLHPVLPGARVSWSSCQGVDSIFSTLGENPVIRIHQDTDSENLPCDKMPSKMSCC